MVLYFRRSKRKTCKEEEEVKIIVPGATKNFTVKFGNFTDTNFYVLSYNFNGKYIIDTSYSIYAVMYQDQFGQTYAKYVTKIGDK